LNCWATQKKKPRVGPRPRNGERADNLYMFIPPFMPGEKGGWGEKLKLNGRPEWSIVREGVREIIFSKGEGKK
jgi:hypothetical protein